MRREKIKDGPLKLAVNQARGPMDRRRALLEYRDNLALISIDAKAWRHGGYLFLFLCALCLGASLLQIWWSFPGAALLPWASWATSFLATYMLGRSSGLLRRAIAGWPPCPS